MRIFAGCDDYDTNCTKDDSCNLNDVCTIADQPVPSRAVATLPGSYLSLNKLSTSHTTTDDVAYGVFAKRNIRKRTQFGPIEGVLCTYDGLPFENALPLLYETETGEFLKVDVSNESKYSLLKRLLLSKTLNFNFYYDFRYLKLDAFCATCTHI